MIIQGSHAPCPISYHFFFPNRMLISKLMHPFIVGLFIDFQFLYVIYLIRFSIQVSLQHNQIANISDISLITLRKNMLYGRIILKNLLLLIITIELLKRILIILAAVAFLVKQRERARRKRQACRHSHSSPEGFSGRPPLRSLPRLSQCRDPKPSRPPLGSQELSLLRCQGMAEGNRLPSLENAPHLKTDGEFFCLFTSFLSPISTLITLGIYILIPQYTPTHTITHANGAVRKQKVCIYQASPIGATLLIMAIT